MENVAVKLTQLGVSTQTTDNFMETLQQCEFARFAPGDSTELMNEMYQKATDFILQNETQRVVTAGDNSQKQFTS
jgi:peptidase E